MRFNFLNGWTWYTIKTTSYTLCHIISVSHYQTYIIGGKRLSDGDIPLGEHHSLEI